MWVNLESAKLDWIGKLFALIIILQIFLQVIDNHIADILTGEIDSGKINMSTV